MKLFFEYVVLQNEKDTIFFARRIEKVRYLLLVHFILLYTIKFSTKINNFQNSDSLSTVATLLYGIEKGLRKL